jgi:3-deoxy-D-manno-octulosonate 8-phosphate phosphatase (KDO 8-P phosphatase)
MKAIVFDVDGTLTDGNIYMGLNGEFMKSFNIKDGYGIHDIMPNYGLIPIIITSRKSEIVRNRCVELGIEHIYQDCHDKLLKLIEIATSLGMVRNERGRYEELAYMGDDNIDLLPMEICGLKGCPADASKEVKSIVDFISTYDGGKGAAREFIEWVIEKNSGNI